MLETKGEKIFNIVNNLLMFLLSALMILPFIHIIAKSFSTDAYVMAREVTLWPLGFQLGAYKHILGNYQFARSFLNTVFITVVGTSIGMLFTIMAGYTVSRKGIPLVRGIMVLFIITMFFSGGMVPAFLLIKNIGLYDSLWAVILVMSVSSYNLIIMKTFIQGIPDSLEESARIDGASTLRVLFQIIIPLSKPVIATLSLFYAVAYWNDYFNSLLFIRKRINIPLQLYMRDLIVDSKGLDTFDQLSDTATESIKAAVIIVAMTPILMVYPFVQKYFVKGIMIGAVKG